MKAGKAANINRLLQLLALLFVTEQVSSQGKFETKIIIEDSLFYAVQIENQLAKFYVGSVDKPIDSASVYALPAGTKRRSANFLPFSWDLAKDTVYAINFTEYPQNNRLTSLKSIPLNSLQLYNPMKEQEQLLQAARLNGYILNLPLKNTISKYKYMDNLFFDVVMNSDTLYQFICVNDELTVWIYSKGKWQPSEIFPFDAHQYFLTFVRSNHIFIVDSKGELFQFDNKPVHLKSLHLRPSEHVLIINRDNGKIYFVKRNAFSDGEESLLSVLDKYANEVKW